MTNQTNLPELYTRKFKKNKQETEKYVSEVLSSLKKKDLDVVFEIIQGSYLSEVRDLFKGVLGLQLEYSSINEHEQFDIYSFNGDFLKVESSGDSWGDDGVNHVCFVKCIKKMVEVIEWEPLICAE
jgi:hypothetical protein